MLLDRVRCHPLVAWLTHQAIQAFPTLTDACGAQLSQKTTMQSFSIFNIQ